METHKVLLVSAGWVHPPYRGRIWLRQALAQLPGFSFDQVASLPQAVQRPLSGYSAVVLYYHYKDARLTDADLEAFRTFVEKGGGVLAVHSATASYKTTPGYFEILGGRFRTHGPVAPMEIQPTQADDPIFGDIPSFTVRDELYVHELQPDIRVHFSATYQGREEPLVWTREVKAGRVCYVGPGHCSASMQDPTLAEILRRGMKWVCRPGGF